MKIIIPWEQICDTEYTQGNYLNTKWLILKEIKVISWNQDTCWNFEINLVTDNILVDNEYSKIPVLKNKWTLLKKSISFWQYEVNLKLKKYTWVLITKIWEPYCKDLMVILNFN